ncbi:MAG TPA: hypothetical protein VK433_03105 [Stellaceae bacterium]|nr:hypothetical protein [Stellaceae bacterium]
MIIGRLLGWLVLILALVAEGADLYGFWDTGSYRAHALGEIWNWIDTASLQLAEAGVSRHISSWLWNSVILNVLQWPAALMLAALALLLLWVFRKRERRRRR